MKKLSQILKPEHLILDLKPVKKAAALETMLGLVTVPALKKNKSKVLSRIMEREELSSTGIGGGLAFPHARVDMAKDLTMLIARSPEGLEFDSIDNEPVHLIFMILWQPEIPGLFNQLFASLIKQVRNRDFYLSLLNADSAETLIENLASVEINIDEPSDYTLGSFSLLLKLMEADSGKSKQQAELIRAEINHTLLERYDKLRVRYKNPVVPVKHGVCTGCFLRVSTGLMGKVKGRTDVLVCENCGRFIGFVS